MNHDDFSNHAGQSLTPESFQKMWDLVREEAGKPLVLEVRTRELPDFAVDAFIRTLGDGEALANHLRNTLVSPHALARIRSEAPVASKLLGLEDP
ncbi:MAG TPA: hypothetical protein VIU64_19520 [Polyangia bacterium]